MFGQDVCVFLSCSFAADDSEVNELVRGVCTGVGLACVNVNAGFSASPSEKAREYISSADGLIAVVTKRDRLDGGDFNSSSAVQAEISIAFGIGKPILIICEKGVKYDGFTDNNTTRLPFSRDELTRPAFVEKLVHSVYTFRQGIVSSQAPQSPTEYISENTRNYVSLDCEGSEYWWTLALTKRLLFEETLQREISTRVWPTVPVRIKAGAEDAEWDVAITASSREFKLHTIRRDIAPDGIDLSLRFDPPPTQGDFIEFRRTFRSRYFSPLFADELPAEHSPIITVDGRSYSLVDGLVVIERTKKLRAYYTFPAEYRLPKDDITPFVASHSFAIDYLVPWELKRVKTEIMPFGPKLVADLRVEYPVPRHMYGIAWSPPTRPPVIRT